MKPLENQNGQDLPKSNSIQSFGNWRNKDDDSDHNYHTSSTNKPASTRTTFSGREDSDLDSIQDQMEQIEVSPLPLQGRKRKHDGKFVSNFVEYFANYNSWKSTITLNSNKVTEPPKRKNKATDTTELNCHNSPRKKITSCQLESRMRKLSFKKHRAYKKNMHYNTKNDPARQILHPNSKTAPQEKKELPRSHLRKRKRKQRRLKEPFEEESGEEHSRETSSP